MKQIILSLMSATLGCAAFAANCVSVKQLSTDYSNHQITLAITRSGCTGDGYSSLHRNTVWVFVDYRTVTGTTKGAWTRATIGTTSAGTVVNSGSSKGAWIYDVNGTQTVTLTLSDMPAKYDWCAFATDLPPFVVADNGTYKLQGTPPFVLAAPNGSTQTVATQSLPAANLQIDATTFTDATGCPSDFCPYTGNDLYRDATHLCGHRTSGAKNWEAWIKDTRDNKTYRIAQLSTGLWTMDDYLNYKGHPAVASELCSAADPNGTEYWRNTVYVNSSTPLCPSGWRLPTQSEYELTVNAWTQYLSKVYKNTGETVSTYYQYCQENGTYLSFIVSDCLQLSSYGQRISSINPVTYLHGEKVCGRSSGQNHRYTGYARCVR